MGGYDWGSRSGGAAVCWGSVISSGKVPDLGTLHSRDPDSFVAGGLHRNSAVGSWYLRVIR